jgi:hypothetical protein
MSVLGPNFILSLIGYLGVVKVQTQDWPSPAARAA